MELYTEIASKSSDIYIFLHIHVYRNAGICLKSIQPMKAKHRTVIRFYTYPLMFSYNMFYMFDGLYRFRVKKQKILSLVSYFSFASWSSLFSPALLSLL